MPSGELSPSWELLDSRCSSYKNSLQPPLHRDPEKGKGTRTLSSSGKRKPSPTSAHQQAVVQDDLYSEEVKEVLGNLGSPFKDLSRKIMGQEYVYLGIK